MKRTGTLEWIDSIGEDEILWDIGTNWFHFAVKSGIRVLAFEPAPANYQLLNYNIQKNGLHHAIWPLFAFSEKTELGSFYIPLKRVALQLIHNP